MQTSGLDIASMNEEPIARVPGKRPVRCGVEDHVDAVLVARAPSKPAPGSVALESCKSLRCQDGTHFVRFQYQDRHAEFLQRLYELLATEPAGRRQRDPDRKTPL
jgi:hypothetical protein